MRVVAAAISSFPQMRWHKLRGSAREQDKCPNYLLTVYQMMGKNSAAVPAIDQK